MPKELDGENEGGGDVRGLQTPVERTAAGIASREKASLGRGGVESLAETKIRATNGIDSASTLAMVGRAIRASFSPPVVAVRLGRVRA